MHFLSIGCFAKNEDPYFPEWIAFHQLAGVDHFYIYDNGSNVPIGEVLKGDVAKGIVTVVDFPGKHLQRPAYQDCLHRFSGDSEWIAFIDVDEFLFATSGQSLKDILPAYREYAGVAVHWSVFGSSGHKTKPPGLQIENFLMMEPENPHIKSIVRPDRVADCPTSHYFHPRNPLVPIVDEAFQPVWSSIVRPCRSKVLRLNHYWARSEQEFLDKCRKGRPDAQAELDPSWLGRVDSVATMEDRAILRFADPLRKALSFRKHP